MPKDQVTDPQKTDAATASSIDKPAEPRNEIKTVRAVSVALICAETRC